MLARIESRIGRIGLLVLLFIVATLVVMVPIGILGSSNLVWGEDNQYGRVDVPGRTVLHLPAGSARVSVAIDIPGRGNGTPDMPLPSDLALSVTPVGGGPAPVISRDLETTSNANDNEVNTQRHVWTVHVPRDGQYRVTTRGDFSGIGVNAQLWFGHGPPIPGALVPVLAAAVVLIAGGLWFGIRSALRRRGSPAVSIPRAAEPVMHAGARRAWAPSHVGDDDAIDRLERLTALHERGALTDAEFETEKARVIGDTST